MDLYHCFKTSPGSWCTPFIWKLVLFARQLTRKRPIASCKTLRDTFLTRRKSHASCTLAVSSKRQPNSPFSVVRNSSSTRSRVDCLERFRNKINKTCHKVNIKLLKMFINTVFHTVYDSVFLS